MIAVCKFCQELIHPLEVLPMKPAQLAKVPAEQIEVMKFSAGVTEHMRSHHKEYVTHVQGLGGTFLGHCMISAVEVAGERAEVFAVITGHDNAMLRAMWEAMPNPPDPDVIAQLQDEAQTRLRQVQAEADAKAKAQAQTQAPAQPQAPAFIPPPPGKIALN